MIVSIKFDLALSKNSEMLPWSSTQGSGMCMDIIETSKHKYIMHTTDPQRHYVLEYVLFKLSVNHWRTL